MSHEGMQAVLDPADMEGWSPVSEGTIIGAVRMFEDEQGEIYQMTFVFPNLPDSGVEGALALINLKLESRGYKPAGPETIAKVKTQIANQMVAGFLQQFLETRQNQNMREEFDPQSVQLALHKGRKGGDA